jgi:hypothetical protein
VTATSSILIALLCSSTADSLDYAFETSPFMRETAYCNPRRAATDVAPSGAYGPVNRAFDETHQGKWYIEEQRYGDSAVAAGITHGDPEAIERGLRIFRWGFRHQSADGSFDCPDRFHSTSFFVESTAHSCLLIRQSPFADKFRRTVDEMIPRIKAAAEWMIIPKNEAAGKKKNAPYTHRRYLLAAALGETGILCGSERLVNASKQYIREGLSLQAPEGYNPEKGGYDSSYHAVGIVLAMRYYSLVADRATQAELKPMLQRATAWLASRVNEEGAIDPTGNTRTGLDQELNRARKPKGISYGNAYRAFAYWSEISGDVRYKQLAQRVADYDRRAKSKS